MKRSILMSEKSQEELRRQAGVYLAGWLSRYRGCAEHIGVDLTPIESISFACCVMTKQSPQSDIPQQLSLFLREMGIAEIKQEVTEPENYVAWLPSYDGEEPPF